MSTLTVVNAEEIPADLAPGAYCCRLDESSTMAEFRVRFVVPAQPHRPGDCLVQVVQAALDTANGTRRQETP